MSEFRPYGLFYDALSGEFTDPHKPNTTHTLARLAVATCLKGAGPSYEREYGPSWAPGTSVLVHQPLFDTEYMDQSVVERVDSGVTLLCEDSTSLNEVTVLNSVGLNSGHRYMGDSIGVYVNSKLVYRAPLELGTDLNWIRGVVSEVAQDFYTQNA